MCSRPGILGPALDVIVMLHNKASPTVKLKSFSKARANLTPQEAQPHHPKFPSHRPKEQPRSRVRSVPRRRSSFFPRRAGTPSTPPLRTVTEKKWSRGPSTPPSPNDQQLQAPSSKSALSLSLSLPGHPLGGQAPKEERVATRPHGAAAVRRRWGRDDAGGSQWHRGGRR